MKFRTILAAASIAAGAFAKALPNGGIWPDIDGIHINAHGGGLVKDGERWYWFGEHKIAGKEGNNAWVGVRCYSSENLVDWKNEGVALAVSKEPGSPIEEGCILERPKVVCAKNGKYVMWFHLEYKNWKELGLPTRYGAAASGVAVADSITGPYRFVRAGRFDVGTWPRELPEAERTEATLGDYTRIPQPWGGFAKLWGAHFKVGQMARDMTLFKDSDGEIYHIFASEDNSTLHVARLSEDGLSHTGEWARISHGDWTEAPAVIKRDGWYYLLGSGCTGWNPNDARYYRSKSIWGPWERMGNPARGVNPANNLGPEKTWGGQSTAIFEENGRVWALFDLWRPANAIDGRYACLAVDFSPDHTISITWRDEFEPSIGD